MRRLRKSRAARSVSMWIKTRSALCPWLEWLVIVYPWSRCGKTRGSRVILRPRSIFSRIAPFDAMSSIVPSSRFAIFKSLLGAVDLLAYRNGVKIDFSRPGKPTVDAFVESFNGKIPAECVDTR